MAPFDISLMSFIVAALATRAQAATTPFAHEVRPSTVLNYLGSIGHPIKWHPVPGNGSLATFTFEEWAKFEDTVRLAGNATRIQTSLSVISRDAADYDEELAALLPRSVSVSCFGSGSWAYDSVLQGFVTTACNAFSYTGIGVHILRYGARNEANDVMDAVYKLAIVAGASIGSQLCKDSLGSLINHYCQGKHTDTRGGVIDTGTGAKLTADPTIDNCNC